MDRGATCVQYTVQLGHVKNCALYLDAQNPGLSNHLKLI